MKSIFLALLFSLFAIGISYAQVQPLNSFQFGYGNPICGGGNFTIIDCSRINNNSIFNSSKSINFGLGSSSSINNSIFNIQTAATGSCNDPVRCYFNLFRVTDSVNETSLNEQSLYYNWWDSFVIGGNLGANRIANNMDFTIHGTVTSPTNPQFTTFRPTMIMGALLGGSVGTPAGTGFAINGGCQIAANAINVAGCAVQENDYNVAVGVNYLDMIFVQNVIGDQHHTKGTRSNASYVTALKVIPGGSTPGIDVLFQDGSFNGWPALDPNGAVFQCYPHGNTGNCGTIDRGVDLSNYAVLTTAILLGPQSNGSIDGSFNFKGPQGQFNGTTAPTMVAGSLFINGVITSPTFGANGEGAIYLTTAGGLNLQGQGTNDLTLRNSAGTAVMTIADGGVATVFGGSVSASSFATTGAGTFSSILVTGTDTPALAAGSLFNAGIITSPTMGADGEGAVYLTAAGGLNLQGRGSTNDFQLKRKDGTVVLNVPTGTATITAPGSFVASGSVTAGSAGLLNFTSRGIISSSGNGVIQIGNADAASPIAQFITTQSVVAGNTNTAGTTLTIRGSLSNGSGAGGDINIQTTQSTAGSGTQNTAINAIIIKGGTQLVTLPAIVSDAGLTDATLCEDTTVHGVHSGSGTAGLCLGTSSERYKNGIVALEVGVKELMMLRPVQYYLNADHVPAGGDPNKLLYGFTAEQGFTAFPKLVSLDAEGRPNSFDYLGVVPPLVKGFQDHEARLKELEAKIK